MAAGTVHESRSIRREGWETLLLHQERGRMAGLDATAEREAAGMRAHKIRGSVGDVQSAARAGFARAGVDVTRGTPATVEKEIASLAEEDALTEILYGMKRAEALDREAEFEMRAGVTAQKQASRRATGSLLSGGAKMFAMGWGR
jgi:hypothetical protein